MRKERKSKHKPRNKRGSNTVKKTLHHTYTYMYNICMPTQCVYIFYINYILYQVIDHCFTRATWRKRERYRENVF